MYPPAPKESIATAYLFLTKEKGVAEQLISAWLAAWQIQSFDQIWLEGGESISIREVRDFERQLQLAPLASPRRIGVIMVAEHLTLEANHALLKFLEDPPVHVTTLLVAEHEDQLLATIVSRCQRWRLPAQNTEHHLQNADINFDNLRGMTIRGRFVLAESWAKSERFVADFDGLVLGSQLAFRKGYLSTTTMEQLLRYRALARTNVNSRLLAETTMLVLGER
jgi:DNA polymerase III delta prime subunit